MVQAPQLAELSALFAAHDFFYEYSEDIRVFREGYQQKQRIMKLLREIPLSTARMYLDRIPSVLRRDWSMAFLIPDYDLRERPDPDVPKLPRSQNLDGFGKGPA